MIVKIAKFPGSARLAVLAFAAPLLSAVPAEARQDDGQFWFQGNIIVPLSGRYRLTLEQITRSSDRQDGIYTTEFGGIFSFKPSAQVELGLGYRRVDGHNGNTARGEHRSRQHVVISQGPIVARLRLDERFHPEGSEIAFRIRPLLRYNYKLTSDGLTLFASHESFFLPNSTKWGQRAGYERMRNIVGVAMPVGKGVSADIGYLNQYRFARGGSPAQMANALSVQLTFNLSTMAAPHADD